MFIYRNESIFIRNLPFFAALDSRNHCAADKSLSINFVLRNDSLEPETFLSNCFASFRAERVFPCDSATRHLLFCSKQIALLLVTIACNYFLRAGFIDAIIYCHFSCAFNVDALNWTDTNTQRSLYVFNLFLFAVLSVCFIILIINNRTLISPPNK